MCVHMHMTHMSVGLHVPSRARGGQRTALRSCSLLPLWGPGMKLTLPGLCNQRLYPPSHLTSTQRWAFGSLPLPAVFTWYCFLISTYHFLPPLPPASPRWNQLFLECSIRTALTKASF